MYRFLISFSLCCAFTFGFAGIPALEREVTLLLNNEPVAGVFRKIQEQTGLIFSYSSNLIDGLPAITLQLKQKTVRETLSLILPKRITYTSKNNYIILKEKPVQKDQKKKELSGYVYDKTTEKKIANVTVYDQESLQAVNTDDYGFYKITVPSEQEKLSINKLNYKDTVIAVAELKDNAITNIPLNPLNDSIKDKDSVNWKSRLQDFSNYTNRLFKNFEGYIHTLNISDTLHRPFQVSIFPYVGTNHALSGNVINNLSINVFGGYARGVDGFEAGSFFNIDRENVKGVQMAGFFNLVGDSVEGTQLAGFFNVTGKSMRGFQGAGFMNSNHGESDGVTAAGFINVNRRRTKGAQLAGFINIAGDSVVGFQGAGYINTAKNVRGVQVSSFFNRAKTVKGAQISGFMNSADSIEGVQVAGFLNHVEYVKGVQVGGFLNTAKVVEGCQIGIINVSDSCTGASIGLFNFVKHGVHQLEVSADEIFYTNLSYRTGTNGFYSVFSTGASFVNNDLRWTFGYGCGTSFKIAGRLRSDITLSAQHVNVNSFADGNSDLYKLYWGVEYRFNKKLSIAAGPTLNFFFSDTLLSDYSSLSIAPYSVYDNTFNNGMNLKGWVGGKVAIRFF